MGLNNDNVIEEIKQRADIVNIINEFLPLKKRGRNFITNCPFHNEKTASFTVSPEKQIYHCFGCNASGNVFTFLMEHEHMNFAEALMYLGNKVGVEVKPLHSGYSRPKEDGEDERRERLVNIHLFVSRYFYKKLYDQYGKEAFAYAKMRGLAKETLEKFKIGYAPFKSEELIEQLEKLGYSQEELLNSGIFSKSMEGRVYSKFFNRLIFPIENVQGKIIGFGGRNLGNGEPKYLNSPETEIFKKKYNLYGLNIAKEEIRKKNQVLLMEGYTDVISVWQKGVLNAVASLGTAFTEEQGRLLLRYANEIVIVYDNDEAGKNAAIRAMEILRPLKGTVRVVEFTGAKDPDEFITKYGLNAFLERVRNAKSSFRYTLDLNKDKYDYKKPEDKVKCIRGVLPEVMSVEDPLLRNEYLKILSEEVDINKEELETIVFNKVETASMGGTATLLRTREKEIDISNPGDKAQLNVLRILVNQLEYGELIKSGNYLAYFNNSLIHDAISAILAVEEKNRSLDYLTEMLKESKLKSLIAYIALKDDTPKMTEEECLKYLKSVQKIHFRNKIEETIQQINIAEKEGNRVRSVELQREWNRYKESLNKL